MQPHNSGGRGFRFSSIIIHSLWITLAGVLFFRLATTNTHSVVYVKILGISGAILATGPWIIQLLVSTIITVLYKTKVYDLTWLVRLPSEEGCCCRNPKVEDEDVEYVTWGRNGNVPRGINDGNNFGMLVPVDAAKGPRLNRNRTI